MHTTLHIPCSLHTPLHIPCSLCLPHPSRGPCRGSSPQAQQASLQGKEDIRVVTGTSHPCTPQLLLLLLLWLLLLLLLWLLLLLLLLWLLLLLLLLFLLLLLLSHSTCSRPLLPLTLLTSCLTPCRCPIPTLQAGQACSHLSQVVC